VRGHISSYRSGRLPAPLVGFEGCESNNLNLVNGGGIDGMDPLAGRGPMKLRAMTFLTALALLDGLGCRSSQGPASFGASANATPQLAPASSKAVEPTSAGPAQLEKAPVDPGEVSVQFLSAMDRGNPAEAWALIPNADKRSKDVRDYIWGGQNDSKPVGKALSAMLTGYTSRNRYEVRQVQVAGERARALVSVTGPDVSYVTLNFLSPAMDLQQQGRDQEALAFLRSHQQSPEVPLKTRTETLPLVRESGEWRVDFSSVRNAEAAPEHQ